MLNSPNRFAIATLFAVVASGSGTFSGVAVAGTHADGHGGAVCKGAGSCLVLEIDCKGTYTDATQPDGTVYGKCSQTAQVAPGFKAKLRAN
jgi:hypothetical protein